MVSYPCLFVAPPGRGFYIRYYFVVGYVCVVICLLSVCCIGFNIPLHPLAVCVSIFVFAKNILAFANFRQKYLTFVATKIRIVFEKCKLRNYGESLFFSFGQNSWSKETDHGALYSL